MKRDVIVKNESGMHARPASIFVKKANGFNSNIEIEAGGKKVNAKSIMGILSLGITKGNQISIIAEGEDATAAVNALVELVESEFGE